MRDKQKTVYYCDHCGAYRLVRSAMEKHEATCTRNPQRLCRWRIDGHSDGSAVIDIAPLAAELRARAVAYPLSSDPESPERTYLEKDDVDWLHDEVAGCPACMLAALRQSGVDEWHLDRRGRTIFSYEQQVEAIRDEERRAASEDLW